MRKRLRTSLVALVLLLGLGCERAEGPAPVAWDRTRCSQCGMLISEPAWAAQLHEVGGPVQHFDDPGCLLVALEDDAPEARASEVKLYFHHLHQDLWIPGDEVAFTPADHSPMGYGIGAVVAGESATEIPFDQARSLAKERDRARQASANPEISPAATR